MIRKRSFAAIVFTVGLGVTGSGQTIKDWYSVASPPFQQDGCYLVQNAGQLEAILLRSGWKKGTAIPTVDWKNKNIVLLTSADQMSKPYAVGSSMDGKAAKVFFAPDAQQNSGVFLLELVDLPPSINNCVVVSREVAGASKTSVVTTAGTPQRVTTTTTTRARPPD